MMTKIKNLFKTPEGPYKLKFDLNKDKQDFLQKNRTTLLNNPKIDVLDSSRLTKMKTNLH